MDDLIKTLYTILEKEKVISSIDKVYSFPDEPSMHIYSAKLKSYKKMNHISNWTGVASGFSLFDSKIALLKCLSEAAERLSNSSFLKNELFFASPDQLDPQEILSPNSFISLKNFSKNIFGWKKGYNFLTKKEIFVPAQTCYFTYPLTTEPQLTEMTSTGAAGGFEKNFAILRAILEVVERDAFMTMYLTKIPPPKIEIKGNKRIKNVIGLLEKYKLELQLFDITSDLQVPCFMSILLDKTPVGPAITIGLKAGFVIEETILGSIQESLHLRNWIKKELVHINFKYVPQKAHIINSLKDRALYWNYSKNVTKLQFLFDEKRYSKTYYSDEISDKKSLEKITTLLKKKNISTYIINITHPIFSHTDYVVYKAIMPELQPVYFNEKNKFISTKRLSTYSLFRNKTDYVLNEEPHPFL